MTPFKEDASFKEEADDANVGVPFIGHGSAIQLRDGGVGGSDIVIVGWKICGSKVAEPSTPIVGHGSASAIHLPTQKCRAGIVERDESRLNPNYGHAILYAHDIILCTRAHDIILHMDIIYGIVYCILFCVLELYIVYCILYIVYCILYIVYIVLRCIIHCIWIV